MVLTSRCVLRLPQRCRVSREYVGRGTGTGVRRNRAKSMAHMRLDSAGASRTLDCEALFQERVFLGDKTTTLRRGM